MGAVAALGAGLTSLFTGWVKHRNEMAEVRVKAYAENLTAILNNRDLKDEFTLLVVSYPMIASFWQAESIEAAWRAIEMAPRWYQYMTSAIYLAIFGIKPIALKFFERKKA